MGKDSIVRLSMRDLMSLKDKLPIDPEQKETYADIWNNVIMKSKNLIEREKEHIKDPAQPDSLVRHYLDDNAKLIIQYRPNLIKKMQEEYKNKGATS